MMKEGNKPFWLINGKPFPTPSGDLKFTSVQAVDSKRNANYQVVAQKINRRQMKFDSVKWDYLTKEEWEYIMNEVNGFYCDVTYYDVLAKEIITRKFYFGDASWKSCFWDTQSSDVAVPIGFVDCACNLIDAGY